MKPSNRWSPQAVAEFREYVKYLRSQPPRQGCPEKTFAELCEEQGIKPIDKDDLLTIIRRAQALEGSP